MAISFVTLITDMQWDITASIGTIAKIDIVKNKFNYTEHLKNAFKLIGGILISILILFVTLYPTYKTQIDVTLIYTFIEIVGFINYPLYNIKICYMQIEYSAIKTTINKQFANTVRFLFSFIPSPYCTGLGQLFSMLYQLIFSNVIVKYDKNNSKKLMIKGDLNN